MTQNLTFTSILPPHRQYELAELMFFNVKQHQFRGDIVNAIELYGIPEIVATDQSLRFTTEKLGDVQTLFVLEGDPETGQLVGVMLYARVTEQEIVLLHVGVASDYASGVAAADRLLVLRLIERLKQIGKAIRGVTQIEILYGRGRTVIRL